MSLRFVLKTPEGKNLIVCLPYRWAASTTSEICTTVFTLKGLSEFKRDCKRTLSPEHYQLVETAVPTPL